MILISFFLIPCDLNILKILLLSYHTVDIKEHSTQYVTHFMLKMGISFVTTNVLGYCETFLT